MMQTVEVQNDYIDVIMLDNDNVVVNIVLDTKTIRL